MILEAHCREQLGELSETGEAGRILGGDGSKEPESRSK